MSKQETVTASAPAKRSRYEERYGPAPIEMDELKCCDCAYCGRELVGPSHRRFAHHFGMMVAVMVHERPYCPSCSKTATSQTFICMTCKRKTPCLQTEFQNGIPYCLACAQPAELPWRNLENKDRHRKGEGIAAFGCTAAGTKLEQLADAAAA